ncbi:MAG TPA: IclR family transcriptional regulator [Geminicoccaceae bacterium]|nr:IclR family transcriptional regulator [Geminicoccus sp.]HMU51535.1 IclR family transcriptional regulator [Geminicoccaceae bacterium]
MSDDPRTSPAADRGTPVIDRLSDLLELLEKRPAGSTIRELAFGSGLPRSTVYRCLNTLEAHAVVRRLPSGTYRLGPRLLALAAQVETDPRERRLAALAQSHLDRLSAVTGEGSKLSVLAGGRALVIAVAQGGAGERVAVGVLAGKTYPIHAGAASKLLLAHLPAPEAAPLLQVPLPRLTVGTVTDPTILAAELAAIRRRGYAQDRGEFVPGVHALATPVRDGAGRVLAAVSMPFLADADARRRVVLRRALRKAAAGLSRELAVTARRAGGRAAG